MGKKRKGDWKPVVLTESLISSGIEGLIGIQELRDYNVEKRGEEPPDSNIKKKKSDNLNSDASTGKSDVVSFGKKGNHNTWIVEPLKKQKRKFEERNNAKLQRKPSTLSFKEHSKISPLKAIDVADQYSKDDVPVGMEAWSSLHVPQPILKALSDLGFKRPTQIQELTLPSAIMGRRDILGAAETGSGKTLAFGIPIIHGILQQKKKNMCAGKQQFKNENPCEEGQYSGDDMQAENEIYVQKLKKVPEPSDDTESEAESVDSAVGDAVMSTNERKLYALILTPTRELAIQIQNHLVAIAKYTNIQIAVVIGGLAPQKQERLLKRRPEVVVATPGRLWEMIENGNPHLEHVSDISFLAIDETDRMLEKGHFQELQTLLERVNQDEFKKRKRQNFVFSATLTFVHEPPKYVGKGGRNPQRVTPGQKLQSIISSLGITDPKVVDITLQKGTASTLSEARIVCSITDKDHYLYYFLLCHTGRTLVFCNSISCVRRLTQILEILQCKPYPLHANMQQRQRLKNLERFRDSPTGLLLATDVAARGLDIPNVQHVIHYQVPRTTESYIHRSGRTARAQKEGITVLLMEPDEVSSYLRLCKNLGRGRDLPDFPVDDSLFSTAKTRVAVARQIDQLEHTVKRNSSQSGWFQKVANEMDILLDDDDIPKKMSDDTSAQIKRQLNGLRKQLKGLIGKPVLPKSSSLKYPSHIVRKDDHHISAVAAIHEKKKLSGTYVKIRK